MYLMVEVFDEERIATVCVKHRQLASLLRLSYQPNDHSTSNTYSFIDKILKKIQVLPKGESLLKRL